MQSQTKRCLVIPVIPPVRHMEMSGGQRTEPTATQVAAEALLVLVKFQLPEQPEVRRPVLKMTRRL